MQTQARMCAWDGLPIPESARADARYCSSRCRTASHRAVFPRELVDEPRWVRFNERKIPLKARGWGVASSTDPDTWTDYATARRSDRGVGLGWVLGPGIVCVDLDGCLTDGVLTPGADELVELAGDTWVEISPSGRGLHILGRGHLEHGRRFTYRDQPTEVYGDQARGRFICMTGRRLTRSTGLGDLSVVLDCLGLSTATVG